MSRLSLALPLAALLLAAPVFAESAKEHAAAAKRAEKAKNWQKALQEWEAAYKLEPSADYQLAMGDAYAQVGDKANAKKSYQAYIADPLALDTDSVKAKIAALDKAGDLGLDAAPAAKPAVAAGDLGLDMGAVPEKGKKATKKEKAAAKKAVADLGLGLDLSPAPAAKPVGDLDLSPAAAAPAKKAERVAAGDLELSPAPAKKAEKMLDLDLSPAPAKTEKVAAAGEPAKKTEKLTDLDLSPAPAKAEKVADLELSPATGKGATKPAPAATPAAPPVAAAATPAVPPAVAAAAPTPKPAAPPAAAPSAPKETPKTVAAGTPASPSMPAAKPAPATALADAQGEKAARSDGARSNTRVIGYVTAGLAVAALATGGVYYSKASQDSTDLKAHVRDGASQQALVEQQKQHKSLSFAGLAAGLVLGGVAGALFAF